MRVTEQQTFGILVNNLQRSRVRALEAQQQVSTGKRVRQPSDDPSAFNHIALDKASLSSIEQRLRNIDFGRTRLDLTDKVLGDATLSLARAQELAVRFRSDVYGPAERTIGAQEVRQIFGQLQQTANSELNGRAIFTGTSTHGRSTGLSITTPVTLTNGTNDTLILVVDGTTSGTIDLTSGTESLSGTALASRLQSRINADTALSSQGKSVTVTFDTDHLVIVSNGYGPASSVEVTGGTSRSSLGMAGGSTTTGAVPFALTATARAASSNTGGGVVSQGRIADENRVTLDDYLIRFSSSTTYDVYDLAAPVGVTVNPANTGGVIKTDAGVVNASQVTLHNYQIQFTSSTQYSVVDTTAGTTLSSGNTYVPGNGITFDGLQVVLTNGDRGGPQAGDTFTVSLNARTVLANQTYSTGAAIAFDGLRIAITNGTGSPAAGDRFTILTGVQYQGDAGIHNIEVGTDQTVQTNVPGNQVFTGPSVDLLASIKNLTVALRGNFGSGIAQGVTDTNLSLSQIGSVQGEVGALSNRLAATSNRLEEAKGFFTETLSQTEDVDLVKAISDLTLQQYALEAASQTLTRVFENTLLKFLR